MVFFLKLDNLEAKLLVLFKDFLGELLAFSEYLEELLRLALYLAEAFLVPVVHKYLRLPPSSGFAISRTPL